MAQPARSRSEGNVPPIDPAAVDRAYRLERARRRARVEHRRQVRRAGLRFWVVLVGLLVLALFLTLSLWREVQRLFGL